MPRVVHAFELVRTGEIRILEPNGTVERIIPIIEEDYFTQA